MDENTKARLALALPLSALVLAIGAGWWLRPGAGNSTDEISEIEPPPVDHTSQATSGIPPAATAPTDLEAITPALSIPLGNGKAQVIEVPEPTPAPIAAASLDALPGSDQPAEADLAFIQDLLKTYRAAYRENPFGGENEEIVAGLTGRNARGLVVLPPEHPSINERGQLLDRWGTPYHFHALSREIMEVTSAGPDLQLFTDDDVRLSLPDSE